MPGYRSKLEFFQALQVLDVLFSVAGLTNNSVFATFPQVSSRIAITFLIFPHIEQTNQWGVYAVGLCMLNWSLIEVVRFGFYATKALKSGPLERVFGHLRYNTFIFAYVLGVTGELVALYFGYQKIAALPSHFLTIHMPNKWNFVFDFVTFLQIAPFIYAAGFPGLYMHMWSQRARFYKPLDATKKAQ